MLREMAMNVETEESKVKSRKSNQLIPTIRYRNDKCHLRKVRGTMLTDQV